MPKRVHDYLKLLKKRKKESRAYTLHQQLGVEIAEILEDTAHTGLYIKLAKERDKQELLRFAKEVAERRHVKNKGAYFMRVISEKSKKQETRNGGSA